MDLKYLYNFFIKNIKWVIIIPLIVGGGVYFKLKNIKDEFVSNALIYTGIATGYNVDNEQQDAFKSDYYKTTVTYDNIIHLINSREAKTMVSIKILVSDLKAGTVNIDGIGEYTSESVDSLLQEIVPDEIEYNDLDQPNLRYDNNLSESDNRIIAKVYDLLNSGNPFLEELIYKNQTSVYCIKNINEKLKVQREGSSDMMSLSYSANDPFRAQQILVEVINVYHFNKF